MNLLASFAVGGFNPWAAGFGIGSLVLFGLVGLLIIAVSIVFAAALGFLVLHFVPGTPF